MVRIIADTRESRKAIKYVQEFAAKLNIETSVEMLPIGDFVCTEKSVCIERKTVQDFYSSIVSQRIFEQTKQMVSNYENCFLIIVGTYRQLALDPNVWHSSIYVFLGAMASLAAKYGLSVMVVENEKQMAYLVTKIVEKQGEPFELKAVRRLRWDKDSQKVSALTAVEGVSLEKARRLLEKFGSISKVCSASIDELCEVNGIGKKTAEKIKEVFS